MLFFFFLVAQNGQAETIGYSENNISYECNTETKTACVVGASVTGEVHIPGKIEAYGTEYAVKAIGKSFNGGGIVVFYGSSPTELVISEGIQEICENALSSATLEKVTLPKSLISISDYAFNGCVALKDIVIPEGVSAIGNNAFLGCTSLTSVSIPKSVVQIGKGVFALCNQLDQIMVASGNSVYDSRENCNAIIVTANNELIQGCLGTVIPLSVSRIGNSAFAGCAFSRFEIPVQITSLGTSVFENCSNLTSISIPESITELSSGTFSYCI